MYVVRITSTHRPHAPAYLVEDLIRNLPTYNIVDATRFLFRDVAEKASKNVRSELYLMPYERVEIIEV